jgi:S1-C subfamily serine protease
METPDQAINPGNSGGALVNLHGQVIGIPTLAATDPQLGSGQAPGIGFAIPSNTVRDIATQLISKGTVTSSHRAYLGVDAAATTGGELLVTDVQEGGPAARAGISAGELIAAVGGTATPDPATLADVLAGLNPGQRVPGTPFGFTPPIAGTSRWFLRGPPSVRLVGTRDRLQGRGDVVELTLGEAAGEVLADAP